MRVWIGTCVYMCVRATTFTYACGTRHVTEKVPSANVIVADPFLKCFSTGHPRYQTLQKQRRESFCAPAGCAVFRGKSISKALVGWVSKMRLISFRWVAGATGLFSISVEDLSFFICLVKTETSVVMDVLWVQYFLMHVCW